MGLLEKLKNTFFEEEYVEVEEKEKPKEKKENKKILKKEPAKPIAKKVEPVEEEPKEAGVEEKEEITEEELVDKVKKETRIESQADTELLKTESSIPYFEEDDFVEVEPTPTVYKRPLPEEKKKLYGGDPSQIYNKVDIPVNKESKPYTNSIQGKSGFKPTPIISPIYGILDKNYRKEEVVDKKDKPSSYVSRKNVDLDFVRNKAFGSLEDDIIQAEPEVEDKKLPVIQEQEEYEDSLLYDMTDTGEAPSVAKVTLADAEEYFEDLGLEYNIDYKDVRYEKATGRRSRITKEEVSDSPATSKKIKKSVKDIEKEETEDKLEDNLFDLVDSMYEEKE